MGAILSYIMGSRRDPNEDVPDPATGLTPREKNMVKKSWEAPRANAKNSGVELLIRFFTKYPQHQHHFKAFKGIPVAELRGNKKLAAHATNVVYALNSLIDHLDDPECLIEMLNKLGENHGRRGITRVEFNDLKSELIQLLKDACNISPECENAWDKTLNVAYSVIFKAIDNTPAEKK